jgi:type IV pilus assembly protein PilC
MSNEFKYQGVAANGKAIQGVLIEDSLSKAKKKIEQMAKRHHVKINTITPRRTFLYTIKLSNKKKIKGRQTAFTKEEVAQALKKIGYEDAYIEPVLLDIKPKVSQDQVLMFVNLSSFLLKEKMSYDKILRLLAEEENNITLREALKKIESELKKGKEGTEVFKKYEHVFGKFPAYMLGLATKSGNMSEVYDATAKFMERDAEYRKSIKQALIAPLATVFLTLVAVGYYVLKIFPDTAAIFLKFDLPLPPMTKFTLEMSDYLQATWWIWFLITAIPLSGLLYWWSTPKGKVQRDKFIIGLPVIGHLLHKSSIEIFFRVFGAIYSGAENNIETLSASAEACRNAYIEKGVKEVAIPLMLKEGMSLVPALANANVFNRSTLSRLKSGSETGNVLASARQISSYYEKETTYKMDNLIQYIQTIIGFFIGIVITLLTLVSAEIAMIDTSSMMN